MAQPSEHLERWIFQSFLKHFKAKIDAAGLTFFAEGMSGKDKAQKWAEFRLDGPYLTQLNDTDTWRVYLEVNILVACTMNPTDILPIHRAVGKIRAAFTDVTIFKLGTTVGVDDPGAVIDCMKLVQEYKGANQLRVNHFGQVGSDKSLVQATVEGHYEVTLDVTSF